MKPLPTITRAAALLLLLAHTGGALAQGPVRVSVAAVVEAPMEQRLSLSGTLVSPQHTNLTSTNQTGTLIGPRILGLDKV